MTEKAQKIIEGLSLTFKILAGLMLFAGLMGFLIASLISILAQHAPLGPDSLFGQSALLAFIFRNIGVLAVGQVILAGFTFYASVQFSKFQTWARDFLEAVAWFWLVMDIGFGVFSMGASPLNFPVFLKSVVLVSMVLWAIPLLVLIGLLRKKEVRDACTNK